MVREISLLVYRRDAASPFADWLASLRNRRAAGAVRARLNRIRLGNFGDCKPVGREVEELRIDFGPGYRVYYGRKGSLVVVLLCGGDKKTQAKDIARAQEYWKEYLDAKVDRED